MEDAYLIHHGIKGQRWGIRRFQNADGSLTNTGKNRYSTSLETSKKIGNKIAEKRKENAANKATDASSNTNRIAAGMEFVSKASLYAAAAYGIAVATGADKVVAKCAKKTVRAFTKYPWE